MENNLTIEFVHTLNGRQFIVLVTPDTEAEIKDYVEVLNLSALELKNKIGEK